MYKLDTNMSENNDFNLIIEHSESRDRACPGMSERAKISQGLNRAVPAALTRDRAGSGALPWSLIPFINRPSRTVPSQTGSSRRLSGIRTRRASAVVKTAVRAAVRAAFRIALIILPLLIIAILSSEKAGALQVTIHNSQFTIRNLQAPIRDSQAPIHNSQLTTRDSQAPIHDARFTIRNSQAPIHNLQFTIHNSQAPIHNSQFTIRSSVPQPIIDDMQTAKDEDEESAAETVEPAPRKIAYITIDDGPSRAITPRILDVLKAEGVKATFFVLPHNGVNDIYRRIIDEGHEIGNHSYSHIYSSLYNSEDIETFREDVIMAREYIWKNFRYRTVSYRFPGGPMGRSASVLEPRREILRGLGYNDFSWNVDTGDSRSGQTDKSAAALTANVLMYTRGREQLIVLMHDTQSKATTLAALPRIISGLRAQGYTFDILRNYYPPTTTYALHRARTTMDMKE